MKVRIVNTTGFARDTKFYVGETVLDNVISVAINPIDSDTGVITAVIEVMAELDVVADAND